jgi:hypothetical protein
VTVPSQASQAGPGERGRLAFATPADWFAVRLPNEPVDADRVASELAATRPELAGGSETLAALLGTLVEACGALNVLCGYATLLDTPEGPLPATLVVSVRDMGGCALDEIAAGLSAGDGSAAVHVFDLPPGRTIRIERRREWPGAASGRAVLSMIVQYVAEIPGTGQAVLLVFSTPAVALAGRLRPVFHQIACTLRFAGGEPAA